MFEGQIFKIFESTAVTEYLTLKKIEMDDQTFIKLLGIKPGEINIILSRTSSFIRNDGKDKTRKDLLNDILEVLERSAVARQFVGIGLQNDYKMFKGFPVRTGDPYERMPDVGQELTLTPKQVFIGWNTDVTQARKDATEYDATKGDPIGGLLVETHIASTQALFDINAVLRTCKAKMTLINQYNEQAAPGKSISKANTDFLATQAPEYHGELEIITSNKVVNTRVLDKWTWDNGDDANKTVKWVGNSTPKDNLAQPKQALSGPGNDTTKPGIAAESTHHNLREMFKESAIQEDCKDCQTVPILEINSYHLEEGFLDKLKDVRNWLSKTAAVTVRGKTMKFLSYLLKQYEYQKQVYAAAAEYAEKIDGSQERIDYAHNQISSIDDMIDDVKEALSVLQQDTGTGISFASPESEKQTAQEEKAPLQSSLEEVFTESTIGIFDRVADAMVNVKDRITRKQLDKIFNRLIRSLENHYHYRLKALEAQKDLLTTDYNSYKGTRFESLPSVQKLRSMIEYTIENIRLVTAMKGDFEKNKRDAANFAFTGKSAPEISPEEKERIRALDKKEDEMDQQEDQIVNQAKEAGEQSKQAQSGGDSTQTVVNKAIDDLNKTTPEVPDVQPNTNQPTPDETKDVDNVINTIDKGFRSQKEPITVPPNEVEPVSGNTPDEKLANWEKQGNNLLPDGTPNPLATKKKRSRIKPLPPKAVQPVETPITPVSPEPAAPKPIQPLPPTPEPEVAPKPIQPTPEPEIPPEVAPITPKVKPIKSGKKKKKVQPVKEPKVSQPQPEPAKPIQPIKPTAKPVEFNNALFRKDTFQNYIHNYEQKKDKEAELSSLTNNPALIAGNKKKIDTAKKELDAINTRLKIIPQDVPTDKLEDALVAYKQWEKDRAAEHQAMKKPIQPAKTQPVKPETAPVANTPPEAPTYNAADGLGSGEKMKDKNIERWERIGELKGFVTLEKQSSIKAFQAAHPEWKKETLGNKVKFIKPAKVAE